MVEQYNCYGSDIRGGEMRPEQDGQWVRHSDYAALEAQLAERVKVKALEWTRGWMNAEAQTEIGQYTITYRRDGSFEWGIGILKGWASSWDAAKAAAQADYERSILSALEATPPAPCVHPIWGQDVDGTRTCGKCGLTTPPTHPEPDFSKSIAGIIKEESAKGAAVGWRSCTGCHETNEGYETGHFPYSKMFGCYVGSGCNECGGIGVTWEYWSEDVLKTMEEDDAPPAPKVTDEMVERAIKAWPDGLSDPRNKVAMRIALTAAQEAGKS